MTRNECARFLTEHDCYAIVTHRRPDGDTIGSATALCLGLRALGKTAHIVENKEITPKYAHLHAGLTKEAPEEGDTIVCVDVASPSMVPAACEWFLAEIALRIDHHCSATSFTPHELVDPGAGACGEIIHDVLAILGVKPDKAMAEAIYTAVSTDTGCFRYANTTAHSLRTAADCAEAGGDLFSINQAIFDTNSLAKLRIQGWIAENTKFYKDGTIAVCALPLQVEQDLGVTEDDMENISGFPRSIEGVRIAATLRQTHGGVKISVRAVPGWDAAKVCEHFGGGGHKGAAGGNTTLPLEEAAKAVTDVMLALF